MAKNLNHEASSQEQEELYQLLEQDPSVQQQFELLTRIWKEKGEGMDDEGHARKLTIKIIQRAETEQEDIEWFTSRRIRRRRRLFIAASLFIVILVSSWFLFFHNSNSPTKKEYSASEALVVNKGSRSRFLLLDGTTVWLNAGSKLFYENDFTGATRELRLEGEAFFDVVKQPNRPFIVHTAGIDIKVLGTAFNVKSYPEDKNVETTLYRGLVNVVRHNAPAENTIQLKPNEKLILSKQPAAAVVAVPGSSTKEIPFEKALPANFILTHIDSTKKESERFETAWLYSRLEFRGDSFEELALKLERWYNVTIVFADDEVKKLNFNGSFEKETIEQAFKGLQAALPFNYKINDHEILVSSVK